MRWWHDIEKWLADPSTTVACIDLTSAKPIPLHDRLACFTEQPQPGSTGLDLFEPDDHIEVIKAFASARSHGSSTTEARLAGGELRRVDFYDENEALGCCVVVLTTASGRRQSDDLNVVEIKVRTAAYHMNSGGIITWAHPDVEPVFGWKPEELVGRSSVEFSHPDDHAQSIALWIELLENGDEATVRLRRRFLTKDDVWKWIEGTSTNYLGDAAEGVVKTDVIDISDELAALEESKRREALMTRLTEALPSGVLHLGSDRRPIFWNHRWTELLNGAEPSIDGLLRQVTDPIEVAQAIERSLTSGIDADIDVTLVADGRHRYGRLHLRPLEYDDGTAEAAVTLDDVTAAREYQQGLHDLAHNDSLTGVLGRLGSQQLIEGLLASKDESRALLFIDLDRFKQINDTHGHATGDAVLRSVAQAISSVVRGRDAVARIGGDEFIVTVRGEDFPEEIVARIHAALREAEAAIEHPVELRASIGIAVVTPTDTFDSVLSRADDAMYDVKRSRHGTRALSPELKPSHPEQ